MRPFVQRVLTKRYLFQGLTAEQIDFVASILEDHKTFKAGETIIKEGDTDQSMFIIESGIL